MSYSQSWGPRHSAWQHLLPPPFRLLPVSEQCLLRVSLLPQEAASIQDLRLLGSFSNVDAPSEETGGGGWGPIAAGPVLLCWSKPGVGVSLSTLEAVAGNLGKHLLASPTAGGRRGPALLPTQPAVALSPQAMMKGRRQRRPRPKPWWRPW